MPPSPWALEFAITRCLHAMSQARLPAGPNRNRQSVAADKNVRCILDRMLGNLL